MTNVGATSLAFANDSHGLPELLIPQTAHARVERDRLPTAPLPEQMNGTDAALATTAMEDRSTWDVLFVCSLLRRCFRGEP